MSTWLAAAVPPLPDGREAAGLAVGLLLFWGFAVLGRAVAGTAGARGVELPVGYAVVAGAIVLAGLAVPGPGLAATAGLVLAVAGAAAAWARPGLRPLVPLARVTVLALPLLAVAAANRPVQWDDYSHWIPNAVYLLRHDAFPAAGLPRSPSHWPGYPYAMPIWSWLIWRGAGFVENAGAMVSGLYLVAAAALLIEAWRGEAPGGPAPAWRDWGRAGAALLAVTALSPSFHRSYSLTGYADTATGVVLAALVWSAGGLLRPDRPDPAASRRLLLQSGLAAILLVSLKQVNLVLLGLAAAGLAGAAWSARVPQRRVVLLGLALVPAVALWLLWQTHAAAQIPGGQFRYRPFAEWRWSLAAPLVRAMAVEAGRVPLHFVALGLVALLAAATRRPGTAPAREAAAGPGTARIPVPDGRSLAVVTLVVALGYTGFLFVTYLAAPFSDDEVRRAASFHRYSGHAGVLALVALARLCAERLAPAVAIPAGRLRIAVLAAAVAASASVPLGWRYFLGTRDYRWAEAFARTTRAVLPAGGPVAVVLPQPAAFVEILLRYQTAKPGAPDGTGFWPGTLVFVTPDDGEGAPAAVASDRRFAAAIVRDAAPETAAAFGLGGDRRGFRWLVREGEAWRVVATEGAR
ncbi:hypothetical protein [Methylobacterium oryzihabitans]|uniref:Glycosyltransferase RgtA/B/C/D-like domain-containing protein n=1 Tax=Methylobacterium oryzihabitans TaxID=2499852 RepID=A0A437P668_9HYPH|nr:hypothetical protein [Methylobacterium oryzihabitans]RVU17754.1 hypothetical protein EOE48_12795 [Methylobacterium oryzihabitans]